MPRVEQYDWDKLKPNLPEKRQNHGTMNFPTTEFREAKKNSKHGAIKTTRKAQWNPKDKRLGRTWHETTQHLKSIMREEI